MLGSLVAVPAVPTTWPHALPDPLEYDIKLDGVQPTVNGVGLHVVSLRGPGAEDVYQALRERYGVDSVQPIYREGGHLQIRIGVPDCPVAEAIWRTGLVPTYPAPVTQNEYHLFVVGQDEPLGAFVQRLNRADVPARIVRRMAVVDGLQDLTPYQYDVLRRALAEGYYDRPRRATLTELAQRVGVAKSTLSETLRSVERKVVHRRVHGRFPPGTLKRSSGSRGNG